MKATRQSTSIDVESSQHRIRVPDSSDMDEDLTTQRAGEHAGSLDDTGMVRRRKDTSPDASAFSQPRNRHGASVDVSAPRSSKIRHSASLGPSAPRSTEKHDTVGDASTSQLSKKYVGDDASTNAPATRSPARLVCQTSAGWDL